MRFATIFSSSFSFSLSLSFVIIMDWLELVHGWAILHFTGLFSLTCPIKRRATSQRPRRNHEAQV